MQEVKQHIRDHMKKLRLGLTHAERETKELAIFTTLEQMQAYKDASTIFCYVDCKGEVRTQKFIERMLRCGKNVLVPRCTNGTMEAVQIRSLSELVRGAYGILEPSGESYVGSIDVSIVPVVAADASNNRLGQGKGYYDAFLKLHLTTSIGLAYDFQMLPNVPVEPHDVKLVHVIYG